jgi:putative ABC transport system permease protein
VKGPRREPPRLAEWLLRKVLPAGVVGDSILGDAREEYAEYTRRGGVAAPAWYWLHALRLVFGYLITKGRDVEMGTIWKDLKFGARALSRMPGSAVISVLVLALGIGLCTSIFSLIYGVYFRGLNVPDADRLYVAYETKVEQDQLQRSVPIQNFVDWRERQTAFEGLLGLTNGTVNLSGSEAPVRFQGASMTANAFTLLRVEPMLGRGFAAGEDVVGAPPNVVLGYKAWRDSFGSDPSVIGRDVRVNGEPATIIGVMPEGFEFPNNTEIWTPLRLDPLASERGQGPYVLVWGRLADGVPREQAEAQLASIARQLEQEYPEVNEGVGAQLDTAVESQTGDELNLIFSALMFAVICVLIVACANVASLLVARAATRTKEAGIRVAMGGGRLRVMLPFFAEALVLAATGALLGIGIAYVGVAWFDDMTAPARTGRPWFMQFVIDWPILAFVVGLTGFTAIVAGVAPAFQMSRTDVNAVLKDESRGSSSLHIGRLSRILVTAEVALSCALLVGAGLMAKSIVNVGNVDYDYETDRLFTARVGLFQADYPDRDARQRLWDDLQRELVAATQIEHAALTTALPQQGGNRRSIALEGVEFEDAGDLPSINRVVVSTGFFETLGTGVTRGRDFVEQDDTASERVAIVNQPMVERYFDGEDPIGRRFREGASDTLPLVTVVGVVPDLDIMGSLPRGFPGFEPAGYYVPLRQNDASFLSIAALPRGGEALSLTADVRGVVRRLDNDLPIYDIFSQTEVIDRAIWFYGVFGTVFIVFGAAALFMASVGLYGVLSFAVSRRTQEMGIRMALGARARDVIGLVARQGVAQLGIGLGIGLALAFGVTRLVSILMYDVDPQDPVVFGGVFAVIIVVGMAAAVFPARHATSIDPVDALRAE